jgi:hypothetical protein
VTIGKDGKFATLIFNQTLLSVIQRNPKAVVPALYADSGAGAGSGSSAPAFLGEGCFDGAVGDSLGVGIEKWGRWLHQFG